MDNIRQINYWTLGGFGNETPVEDVLRQAKEMGYDGVELAFETGGVLCPDTSEKTCRGYREAAERRGLRLATLASGVAWNAPLGHPDPAVRRDAVAFTRAYLRAAAWVGAQAALVIPATVAVPWASSAPAARYDEAWEHATRGVWQVLPLAEKLGVAIALENVWNWFLADPVAMRTFVDQFRSPWVGTYFDVGNCLVNGYPEHWIAILGHRIKAVHAKNFTRSDSGGGLSGFGEDLLAGDADWPAVVAALAAAGYEGPVTAEMVPFCRGADLRLPDPALARDAAPKLRAILQGPAAR